MKIKGLSCPVCHSEQTELFLTKKARKFFLCRNCSLQFIDQLSSGGDLYNRNYWNQENSRQDASCGYTAYLAEEEVLKKYFRDILSQVNKLLPNSGRVLDIGCSFGFFLEVMKARGNWQVYGVELSSEAVRGAKKRLKSKNIYHQTLEAAKFPANYFDFVTIFQTIEHVDNPLELLKEARRILKPEGVMLIATPDSGGWQAKLMGGRWFSYRHLDHLLFFNYQSLSEALNRSGFKGIRRLADPAYWHRLDYLIDKVKFYINSRFLVKSINWVKTLLNPWLKIKIPLPLLSVVVVSKK